jgi:hypothetical protein
MRRPETIAVFFSPYGCDISSPSLTYVEVLAIARRLVVPRGPSPGG